MTVSQLISKLQKMPLDAVVISTGSCDGRPEEAEHCYLLDPKDNYDKSMMEQIRTSATKFVYVGE